MRGLGILAAIAVLTVGALASGDTGLSPKERVWVEKNMLLLRAQLQNGSAAQFRNVTVSYKMNGRTPIVCGEVNPRSASGDYSGFQGWIGAGSVGQVVAGALKPGEFPKLWDQLCG